MDLPRMKRSSNGGGMLDNIKDRLGLPGKGASGRGDRESGYDSYDGYDEYEDYDEYREDGGYVNDAYADYDAYDADVSYSDSYPSYYNGANRSQSRAKADAHARLVSIDDVKANTQVPARLGRDPLPPRRTASRASSFPSRTDAGHANDYHSSYADSALNADAASAAGARRPGYDGLFSSTAESASALSTAKPIAGPASSPAAAPAASYDPYAAYEGGGVSTHAPSRNLTVLRPASYGEVESIARSLKANDVVVLSLAATPHELAKRVLDFSFGVSSAFDASVDCVADKVFVIARGTGLTEVERSSLRLKGVL